MTELLSVIDLPDLGDDLVVDSTVAIFLRYRTPATLFVGIVRNSGSSIVISKHIPDAVIEVGPPKPHWQT